MVVYARCRLALNDNVHAIPWVMYVVPGIVLIEIIDLCYAPKLLNQNESITHEIDLYPEHLKEQLQNFPCPGYRNPGDILESIKWIFAKVVAFGRCIFWSI